MKYIIGTRGSKLALVQTKLVIQNLKSAYPQDEFIAKVIKTTGDMDQKRRLDEIGSKGIFVKEIEDELLDGTISMAVHSMKDMPDEPAEGLIFAKAWKREDPRDVLILKKAESLDELPYRAVIGTGSKRRAYQISAMRPDLKIVSIRGNVDTRIRKLKEGQLCEGEILDGIMAATQNKLRSIFANYDAAMREAIETSYGESSGNISELLENRPELTGTNREKLLSMVQDTKLAAYINEVYRPGASVGDGGTADKLIMEFYEGSSRHLPKAKERLVGINRIIDSGKLGLNDLDIAEALRDDLEYAIDLFK